MIDQISAEIIKSLQSWSRKKTFLIALLPLLLLTFVFIQTFTRTDEAFVIAVVNEDGANFWTEKFIEALESHNGTIPYFKAVITSETEAENLFESRQTFVIMWIPQGFSQNLTAGNPITLRAKINNIHEDLSKNLRLGLDARIFQFIEQNQLETNIRPGISLEPSLIYAVELPRPDYMMTGVLVLASVFFSLFTGGVLGSEEKDQNTITEILMSKHGLIHVISGKLIATMLASAILIAIVIVLNWLFYGTGFPNFVAIGSFCAVFMCLSFIFGLIGVVYGLKAGDFRLIPAPTIIISFVLWIISGAINPLEFSAGNELLQLLPTASAIRILTIAMFGRGIEYLFEAWLILGFWTILTFFIFAVAMLKILRTEK
ncbi:MAG: ABC transporter permease [Promethearchaeota archaeon]